ncbi:hypothetical protein O976_18950 [Mycobacterium avium subsp. paratuberculosis 10-8425]|nr:hypothetical protein O976_18950 [Mycobacterium avium subsp. paratuberculosis 10-8425]
MHGPVRGADLGDQIGDGDAAAGVASARLVVVLGCGDGLEGGGVRPPPVQAVVGRGSKKRSQGAAAKLGDGPTGIG